MMTNLVRSMDMAVLTVAARDAVGLTAVASISFGAGLAYKPAGFIVGGIVILAGVLITARGAGSVGQA